MKRSLTLHRETLAELVEADLSAVVGGHQYSAAGLTCPAVGCLVKFTQNDGTCASGIGCPLTDHCA